MYIYLAKKVKSFPYFEIISLFVLKSKFLIIKILDIDAK
jgi:hypothetical protein